MHALASFALVAFWSGIGQPHPATLDVAYLVVGSQQCHMVGFTRDELDWVVDDFVQKNGYGTRAKLARTTYFRKILTQTRAHFVQDAQSACEIATDSYARLFGREI